MGILVLGIGNLLLSDEAVGVRIVEALEQRFHIPAGVEVLDGGTAGLELMEAMANREHLIVADAVLTGQSPGSVVVLRDKEIPAMFSRKVSPHQLGLCDVLMALQLTDEFPRQLTLVGVVPESLAPKIGLTPTVTQAIEPALEQIIAALQVSGITLKAREESHV
ncbi:hydrogenase 2 maturation endopeptidase [Yersinia frederiksenii]|uniref:HyaD/HybD family hydrogenase maturation endopeptidase n=1 Tax=Yersinia alsatica TaxID=2890317 RepID=A0ABY5USM7_9GAMM|nr:HyaD/HybD family hydrogenase maturation endopeptidase [Yersinia alsatica]OWF70227.1 hydrogenase expression/formation protein [Yersinia frederiksenii]OWF83100.1 hydrogenase expression/formation protein [Yersinia frederiksenii]UWM46498.1 HyaD/HybD family hydrogenase maturation endopeptidase [Yersinia alsatica]CFQ54309.1 hydrogenase 2 maturation endopeptidase [Yersinia frederiksenii]CND28893.1 hydrogenase 2 maturation endopeptidase [Yersinia frederiksenii]